MAPRAKSILRTLAFVALFAGAAGAQWGYDALKPPPVPYSFTHYPPAFLKIADLGMHSATASMLWLNLIQEVGGMNIAHIEGIDTMVQGVRTINAMDPKFSYPYAFGTLIIPALDSKEAHAAIDIGNAGIAAGINDWRIPYYIGAIYHVHLHDNENAIKYFNEAAATPGMPDNMRMYAVSFATSTSDREFSRGMWKSIYESSDDDVVREQAKGNLEHLNLLDLLEQAVAAYKRQRGVYPQRLDDVVRAGILTEIPPDPLGATFSIDENGHIIQSAEPAKTP